MPERQPQIIGVSAPMQRVYGLIHQASAYTYPVLITGKRRRQDASGPGDSFLVPAKRKRLRYLRLFQFRAHLGRI